MGKENKGKDLSNVVDLTEFKKEKDRKKEAELRAKIIARAVKEAKERGR